MKRGDRLADRYELVERIGEGGMGEVWRGEQLALGRAVAIKVIHREHGEGSQELRDRFRREAELAAKSSTGTSSTSSTTGSRTTTTSTW